MFDYVWMRFPEYDVHGFRIPGYQRRQCGYNGFDTFVTAHEAKGEQHVAVGQTQFVARGLPLIA